MTSEEKVVPVVPAGGNAISPAGKRKQVAPWARFCFRLSNYTESDWKRLVSSNSSIVPVLGMQEEGGPGTTEDTPHIQGFGTWKRGTKKRPVAFWKKILGHDRTHFEKMKGSIAECTDYCTREFHKERPENRKRAVGGRVYTRGCPEPIVRMTWALARPLQKEIANKYKEREDPLFGRYIHWYYEEEGNWGKSKTATLMIDQMGATEVSGCKKDVTFGISKLVEKFGNCPPIVIVDIPRDGETYVSYAGLEKIKDGKFFSEKFESGMCRFNVPHIVCFANSPPIYSKMSMDRWKVFNVSESVSEPIDNDLMNWSID